MNKKPSIQFFIAVFMLAFGVFFTKAFVEAAECALGNTCIYFDHVFTQDLDGNGSEIGQSVGQAKLPETIRLQLDTDLSNVFCDRARVVVNFKDAKGQIVDQWNSPPICAGEHTLHNPNFQLSNGAGEYTVEVITQFWSILHGEFDVELRIFEGGLIGHEATPNPPFPPLPTK